MHTIPLNISEPLVCLDIFCIIWVDIATSKILVWDACNRLLLQPVSLGAEPVVLVSDDASHQILTSLADYRFVRKGKGFPVFLVAEVRQE